MKQYYEVILVGILIVFMLIVIFMINLGANYNSNYHNKIVFERNGSYWMEKQCVITTKTGRYVSIDENNNLTILLIPDSSSNWWYVYNNTNPSSGTFRNNKSGLYMSYNEDKQGELVNASQVNINFDKIFTINRNGEGLINIVTPLGLHITLRETTFTLEEHEGSESQFIVTSCAIE